MDTWKFFDITHREHMVCNPTSDEKLARLVGLLRLPDHARVVDIACGEGAFATPLACGLRLRGECRAAFARVSRTVRGNSKS
jgi:hypothetical protein